MASTFSGTIISEWDDGYALWHDILSSSEKDENILIDQLCAVMNHFGFDGWLLNVENRIDPDKIPRLVHFVRKLCWATKAVSVNRRKKEFQLVDIFYEITSCRTSASTRFISYLPLSIEERAVW